MPSFSASIKIEDGATPFLKKVSAALDDKSPLFAHMVPFLETLVRNHLIAEEPKRHKTADRLGAKRTGFMADAARSISSASDTTAAVVTIGAPGFGRAFGPVTIKPTRSKALTIPVHKDAYGARARSLRGLFIIPNQGGGKGSGRLVRKTADGGIETMYILRKSIDQPQDRGLLPSDERLAETAERGAIDFIRTVESETEGEVEVHETV